MRLCEYGCGQEAKYQFKNGKYCCSKHHNMCQASKKVLSDNNKNKKHIWTENGRRTFSESTKNRVPWNKGKEGCFSRESREKQADKIRGKPSWNSGKVNVYSEKTIRSISRKVTENWKDSEFVKKVCESFSHGMNKQENKVNTILENLNLGYKYTGNFSFMVGGKNPDFTNFSKNKVIDFFGSWYHGEKHRGELYNDFSSNKEHEQDRVNHFKKYGFDCLIIWEDELKSIDTLVNKIKNF